MKDGTKIDVESGEGLLDARALWAARVGPFRLALAQRRTVILSRDHAVEVAKNIGAGDAYVFVGVALVSESPDGETDAAMASNSDQMGVNTAIPLTLNSGAAGFNSASGFNGFMQLLLPGEQLFMQLKGSSDLLPAERRIVVAQVKF